MELELFRTYYPEGTNGDIIHEGALVIRSIELPWKNNQAGISCIPEGRYELHKRFSPKFCHHLEVMNVPQRNYILIHPANDALLELRGCIAPVSLLTGMGRGSGSGKALQKLISLVFPVLEQDKQVFLTIKNKEYDTHR